MAASLNMTAILENDKPDTIDAIEALALERYPLVECKTEHFFIPDFYCRRCTMPAGSMITSAIHLQKHPFWITKGCLDVWTENEGWTHYEAPFCGITTPGTRRILIIHEETVWVTFQRSDSKDPLQIEKELTKQHVNPLVPKEIMEAATQISRGEVKYLPAEERIS